MLYKISLLLLFLSLSSCVSADIRLTERSNAMETEILNVLIENLLESGNFIPPITEKEFLGKWSMNHEDHYGFYTGYKMEIKKHSSDEVFFAVFQTTSGHSNTLLNIGVKVFANEGILRFEYLVFKDGVAKSSSIFNVFYTMNTEATLTIDPKNRNKIYVSIRNKDNPSVSSPFSDFILYRVHED